MPFCGERKQKIYRNTNCFSVHPNQEEQALYIFAGQRHKDYLSDFYRYDIETDVLTELCRDSSTQVCGVRAESTSMEQALT